MACAETRWSGLDDDFNHRFRPGGVYLRVPAKRPCARPGGTGGGEQTLIIGPMSEGDAAYFAQFARLAGPWQQVLGRTGRQQRRAGGLGPVSAGDAAMAQLLAAYLGLAAIAEDV